MLWGGKDDAVLRPEFQTHAYFDLGLFKQKIVIEPKSFWNQAC